MVSCQVAEFWERKSGGKVLTEVMAWIYRVVHSLQHLGDAHVELGAIFQVKPFTLFVTVRVSIQRA